jgi:hypothetical protein
MANSLTQVNSLCDGARSLSKRWRSLFVDVTDFVKNNTVQSINWGSPPSLVTNDLDVNGNINGYAFTPAQMSNVIGSFAQLLNLVNNAAVSQGDHASNIYAVASDSSVP